MQYKSGEMLPYTGHTIFSYLLMVGSGIAYANNDDNLLLKAMLIFSIGLCGYYSFKSCTTSTEEPEIIPATDENTYVKYITTSSIFANLKFPTSRILQQYYNVNHFTNHSISGHDYYVYENNNQLELMENQTIKEHEQLKSDIRFGISMLRWIC